MIWGYHYFWKHPVEHLKQFNLQWFYVSLSLVLMFLMKKINPKQIHTLGVAPSNSEHQDYIFSRGSLQTFIYHCYWGGTLGCPRKLVNG